MRETIRCPCAKEPALRWPPRPALTPRDRRRCSREGEGGRGRRAAPAGDCGCRGRSGFDRLYSASSLVRLHLIIMVCACVRACVRV